MSTSTKKDYIKRGFVQTPHGNIEYRESGPADGKPLIMLHPTPRSSSFYIGAFPLLDDEVRCIAMSTVGYGESDRPTVPYTTIEEFAQSVTWLMDGLGLDKSNVFGTHTGAVIAAGVGAHHQDRVDKLIIEECFNWNTEARRAVHLRIHDRPEKEDGSHLSEMWLSVHQSNADGQKSEGENTPEAIRFGFLDVLKANIGSVPDSYGGMSWEGAGPWSMCHYDLWENAVNITAPTLVIHGTNSELGRSQEKFLATIPNATGIRIPATNRMTFAKNPEIWSKEIKAFLNK